MSEQEPQILAHTMEVWVLSDETPFSDWEEAGGLVVGVFATREAALFYLEHVELGEERAKRIVWESPHHPGRWEGTYVDDRGNEQLYILHCYTVETEAQLRTNHEAQCQRIAAYIEKRKRAGLMP